MSTLPKVKVPTHSRTASLIAAILPAVALAVVAWIIYHFASLVPAHHTPESKAVSPVVTHSLATDPGKKSSATGHQTVYDPGDNDPDVNRE